MEDWVVILESHGSFTYCKLRNISRDYCIYLCIFPGEYTWRCYPWCCLSGCPSSCWTARRSSQLAPWTPLIALLACWVDYCADTRNKKLLLSKYHTAWHAVHVVDSAQGDGWLGNCAAGHDALLARGWWLGQLRAHPCGTVRPLYVWNRRNKLNNVMNDLIS